MTRVNTQIGKVPQVFATNHHIHSRWKQRALHPSGILLPCDTWLHSWPYSPLSTSHLPQQGMGSGISTPYLSASASLVHTIFQNPTSTYDHRSLSASQLYTIFANTLSPQMKFKPYSTVIPASCVQERVEHELSSRQVTSPLCEQIYNY